LDLGETRHARMSYYVVHGTFAATMFEDQNAADAGIATADLAISF
jgi:hypothetical protein